MKKLIFLLLCGFTAFSQQGNFPLPSWSIGTWTNNSGNDTITITSESITWTSNESDVIVSYVDYILHNDAIIFSFSSYPNVYILSIEKRSRIKLIFDAQTVEGYSRRNDTYLKQVRGKNKN